MIQLSGWMKFFVYTATISLVIVGIIFAIFELLFNQTLALRGITTWDLLLSFGIAFLFIFIFVAQLMLSASIGGFFLGQDYRDWGRGRKKKGKR